MARDGWVSTVDLTSGQIVQARAAGQLCVDEAGRGWVLRTDALALGWVDPDDVTQPYDVRSDGVSRTDRHG